MTSRGRSDPDFRLVTGFRYQCLPGCGLCCYTTPAVAPRERGRLIQLDPHVPLMDTDGGWAQIASRPEGGACHFLREQRCACHAERPATCGEFPLTTNVGGRIQVSLVLSCPGVELTPLLRRASGAPLGEMSPDLQSEVRFVREEIRQAERSGQLRWAVQRRRSVERRLRRTGQWQAEEEVRERIRPHLEDFVPLELTPPEVPEEPEPLSSLPMFYDPEFGRVAFRAHPAGIEFVTLRENGGIDRHLGAFNSPTRSPGLDAQARSLLWGYVSYLLDRDAIFGIAYHYLLEGKTGSPESVMAAELRSAADQVIRLAALRRALTSDRRGALNQMDIEKGIRATDMDLLDRPTSGFRL
jgi:Fe-S-cluster containining protein